ncbi:PREDICTED: testicular haploid expressed gene protein-like [Calidris pugnax]|uniref:testicular haploid expressed gene protein-like n=1 Tax=Calidris pugnax TaxID=198806 RepID=UPI00071D1EBB|nr:PREDICTED: testicular haploid expressed gene protein-like [Calidris pugnax]
MEFLEIGGSESLRSYWKMYLPKVLLLIYVVDSADHARLPVAKQLLHQLIQNNSTLPVVVLANKQDLKGAFCITDIHDALALSDLGDERKMFLIGTHVAEDGSEISSSMKDAKELIAQLVLEAQGVLPPDPPGLPWSLPPLCEGRVPSRPLPSLPPQTGGFPGPAAEEAGTGDGRASSALLLSQAEEQAAQAAGVNKCLTWPLLVFAVSCYFSARSYDRIQELAEPKKAARPNNRGFVWGNQETIWTLSRSALTARPSRRIVALAKPKQCFSRHQCRSVVKGRPPRVNFGLPSDRLLKLSEPKKCPSAYLRQRPRLSPEWPVSPAALRHKASPRTLELARPKVLHTEFLMAREVPTQITTAAALASASSRVQRLAEPRVRKVNCCYEHSFLESVIRPVSKFAQEAVASPRILELARPKRLHPDYVHLRDPEWPVTKAAKQAVATPRLVELAQPCKRPPMSSVQFNPDAFTVKEAAKKATCSARIQELAQPIKR